MFKHVDAYAGDPILSLMETFKADPRAAKVNLSIGLYYDAAGVVPQLAAVGEAEKRLAGQPHEASLYLPMEGLGSYRQAIQTLLFGAEHPALSDGRVATVQTVGGSGALKHSWERLRKAGASVRQMMVQAAANQWKVDASTCKTSKGFVLGPSGQKASYGSLAAEAAKLPVPATVTYKDRKDYQIIGTRVSGVDNKSIVTGKPVFGIDVRKPGMVFAQIVRPPFGATLKSFSAEDVKKMPGIIDVVSFKNKVAIVGTSTYEIMQARQNLTCSYGSEAPLEGNDTHQAWFDAGMKSDKATLQRKDGDFAKVTHQQKTY